MEVDFGGQGEIAFERRGYAGLVRLTRPASLNALTHGMIKALRRALIAWEADPQVACVIVEGEGRAFCAGGDVVAAFNAGRNGSPPYEFFSDEYRLNAHIDRYSKPYIAFLDGIVMGGGAGISVHGSHRVVTENTLFAMPEVGIGFFPDVGGSAFLPHLPGHFGAYLALTGNRIRQGDCLGSGIATHAIPAAEIQRIRSRLVDTGDVEATFANMADMPGPDFETGAQTRELIAQSFCELTLEACIAALSKKAQAGSETAQDILAILESRSPTSLHVTFRQIAEGRALKMDDCMRMEYRILNRMLEGHDFYEGVRVALIDKGSTPQWKPARHEEIAPGDIDAYFAPLPQGNPQGDPKGELTLP
ncbi:enoyl-CoA hydratase/isomerase family protein [Phyllobacterium salinisoli]|uniref:3-hydroxyisobutyryl-CoA hydrolase n=1 Tax=Phyllobacterium salinisoli TaxID=1899321 RepID=A0A368K3S8_9HYPH|nr:enoyl-CoA hydratase/isomerase family protein [Phyllobacterium salinisoli]RCS23123.1 enoyl-CoA hydratase/isomerase family protein [Phyllobacterium salinisoli]